MYRTRSGRVTKKPDFYVPSEQVEDDFAEHEYDTEDDSDIDTEDELDDDESEDSDDEDLKDFIVEDEDEEN